MEKNIFDVITEYSVNEGMDDALLQNEKYIEIQNRISEQTEQFDKLNLTKEQRFIIDRLISFHVECGAFYGQMTYRKGFRDCALLLLEMNLLKVS